MTIDIGSRFPPVPPIEIPLAMSNFNHTVDPGLESALRADGTVHGTHAAWDHFGFVWYEPPASVDESGYFHELVRQYMVTVALVSVPDVGEDPLMDLMQKVNDQFGWE